MKRYMFNTLLLALTAVFTGCGGGSDDPQPTHSPLLQRSPYRRRLSAHLPKEAATQLTLPPLEKSGVFIPMATS